MGLHVLSISVPYYEPEFKAIWFPGLLPRQKKKCFLAVDNATVPTNPVSVLSPKASKSSHCKRKPYDDVSPGRSRYEARSGTKCSKGNGCRLEKSIRLKGGGWVGSEATDFDFLFNNLCQSVSFLLYNPRSPMGRLASAQGKHTSREECH